MRPHVLGIDDGPFDKRTNATVPIVGVMMEGNDLVEAVAVTEFPVDGEDATGFLADWVSGLRFASALHGVVLGGMTIAGLGIVDVPRMAEALDVAIMVVNRHDTRNDRLAAALDAAGLGDRKPLLDAAPGAWKLEDGLYVRHAGADRDAVRRILLATRNKSQLPEPLRLAHLIGAAVSNGQSRGRP